MGRVLLATCLLFLVGCENISGVVISTPDCKVIVNEPVSVVVSSDVCTVEVGDGN